MICKLRNNVRVFQKQSSSHFVLLQLVSENVTFLLKVDTTVSEQLHVVECECVALLLFRFFLSCDFVTKTYYTILQRETLFILRVTETSKHTTLFILVTHHLSLSRSFSLAQWPSPIVAFIKYQVLALFSFVVYVSFSFYNFVPSKKSLFVKKISSLLVYFHNKVKYENKRQRTKINWLKVCFPKS